MSARDVIAKQIELQAWAALGIGDTIAYRNRRVSSERKADRIIAALNAAGYVIQSPDEAAQIAELSAERDLLQDILDSRPTINAALPDSYIRWSQAIYSGDSIRALKGSTP